MSNKGKTITLMVPSSISETLDEEDRGGGETYGFKELLRRVVRSEEVDLETFKNNIERTVDQIDELLDKIGNKVKGSWKVESISVGLSVTAEGSIGIVTGGVETSIRVSFCPK